MNDFLYFVVKQEEDEKDETWKLLRSIYVSSFMLGEEEKEWKRRQLNVCFLSARLYNMICIYVYVYVRICVCMNLQFMVNAPIVI